MAALLTEQEKTKAVITKAEDMIKELEETVQAMPEKPERVISPVLLGAAAGSIVLSLVLYAGKKKEDAMFVGLWAPTFLALGLFKDLLKMGKKAS